MPQRPVTEEISYTNSPGIRHISFEVDNIQDCYVAGFSFAYFKDPEGNIIELNQLP